MYSCEHRLLMWQIPGVPEIQLVSKVFNISNECNINPNITSYIAIVLNMQVP